MAFDATDFRRSLLNGGWELMEWSWNTSTLLCPRGRRIVCIWEGHYKSGHYMEELCTTFMTHLLG